MHGQQNIKSVNTKVVRWFITYRYKFNTNCALHLTIF